MGTGRGAVDAPWRLPLFIPSIGGHKCIHRANRVALRVQQYATGETEIGTHSVTHGALFKKRIPSENCVNRTAELLKNSARGL